MWAQVKGRTENALLSLFPNAYMFRLAALRSMHGEVSKTRWTRISYGLFHPLLPLVRAIAPSAVITTQELGRAMIRVARKGAPKRVLENRAYARWGVNRKMLIKKSSNHFISKENLCNMNRNLKGQFRP
jgi:hypothetical protein